MHSGSLRHLIMQESHNCGHIGVDKILAVVRSRFFWPSIDRDVAYYVKRCPVCQRGQGTTTNASTYTIPSPTRPRLISPWILWLVCLGVYMAEIRSLWW